MDAEGTQPARSGGFPTGPAADLSLAVRSEGRAQIVEIGGSLRLGQAEELRTRLPQLVRPEAPDLLLDLSRLEFMASAGIAAIIATHHQARRLGGRVLIAAPRPQIARLLHVTRVDELIPVLPDLGAAREMLDSNLPSS